MRSLRKDKRKIYVSKRLPYVSILNKDNNFTGEYAKIYDTPTELFLNIKPISNDTERQMFGEDTNKILKISYTLYDSQNFEIVNYSAVWIDIEPNGILTNEDYNCPMNNNYMVIKTLNLGNQNMSYIKRVAGLRHEN